MHTKESLLREIRRLLLLGLGGMLGLVIVVQTLSHYFDYATLSDKMRAGFVEEQKKSIRREVQRIVDRVNYQKSILEKSAANQARERARLAGEMVENMLQQHRGEPLAKIRPRLLDALKAMRFDGGRGYFFVLDRQGVVLMHPINPALEGQALENLPDSSGLGLRTFFNRLALNGGEGAVTYRFPKPGEPGKTFTKTTYAKYFPPLDWMIGTGVYLDDLEKEVKRDLLAEIQKMRFGQDGYLFVDDWQGVVLAHGAQPDLVGKNIWNHQDPNGVKVVQGLIAAAQTRDGDYIRYSWKKPGTNLERPKISYAMGIPDWQWMIGTGVYTDEIDGQIAQMREAVTRGLTSSILATLAGGAAVGLFFFVWLSRIYERILTDLNQFGVFFSRAPHSEERLEPERLRYVEHAELAGHVNWMLGQKVAAERELHAYHANLEELIRQRTAQLEEKTQELQRLATTDPLTGLLNRRSFSDLAEQHLREKVRYEGDSCLVMMDLDHFKAINDRFGHEAGDAVLCAVTRIVHAQLREADLFGRWGGEEFTILLPHTALDAALEISHRLSAALYESTIEPAGRVSASFGVTPIRKDENLNSLVKRADAALYKAKEAGRNRVEVI